MTVIVTGMSGWDKFSLYSHCSPPDPHSSKSREHRRAHSLRDTHHMGTTATLESPKGHRASDPLRCVVPGCRHRTAPAPQARRGR